MLNRKLNIAKLLVVFALAANTIGAFAEKAKTIVVKGAEVFRNLEYVPNGHERQRLDIYVPKQPGEPRPLINHESMVLFGERAYEGLVAYVFIELANQAPELEGVILDIEMAPLPDPVVAETRREITQPSRPDRPVDRLVVFGEH